jgi:hypothetical protein
MASKSQLLSVDEWAASSVTEKRLEELVHDELLRPKTSRSQPEWIAPPSDHREPAPPEGYVVSFICFHERGFDVLASPFMCALLHYYKVELHHLAPNAVSLAAIFVAVCQGGVLRQEGGGARDAARGACGELRVAGSVWS